MMIALQLKKNKTYQILPVRIKSALIPKPIKASIPTSAMYGKTATATCQQEVPIADKPETKESITTSTKTPPKLF